MMIVMSTNATALEIDDVVRRVQAFGLGAHTSKGMERCVIGVVGDGRALDRESLLLLPGVDRIVPITRPYKLASREFHPHDTAFPLDGMTLGGRDLVLIAGPCAVESRSLLLETAYAVREAGAHALRGGAFKPRTSPYTFQGLGEEGLELLAEASEATGLPIVTEVMDGEHVARVAEVADVLQVGARNMQNYALLHAVGASGHPVLLKRGMSATVEELLMSAEYILSHDNQRVFLCERGIRTFETSTRNTTDINAIPVLKSLTHLPVILDPSHSTGKWEFVESIALAGVAVGADGLMVEVHPDPTAALSDGVQSLKPERFARLVTRARAVAEAVGRGVAPVAAPVRSAHA